MAVLKVARQLNLVRDLDRVTLPGHEPVQIPEALLQRAIEHGNEPLLVDAMALVCSHPKSTAVPGMAPAHYYLLHPLHAPTWCSHSPVGWVLSDLCRGLQAPSERRKLYSEGSS